jgi:hypothetical protein
LYTHIREKVLISNSYRTKRDTVLNLQEKGVSQVAINKSTHLISNF